MLKLLIIIVEMTTKVRKNKFMAFDNDSETMQMIYSDKSHDGDYWFTYRQRRRCYSFIR